MTEIQTEQTKNYQGGSKQKDQAYSDVRMYENSTPLDPAMFQAFARSVLWTSAHTNLQESRSSTHSEGENTGRTGEVTSVSQSLQNHFLSLAQPYPNCTQHIQIGTMNVYHGAGPSQPTGHSDCKPAKRRRIIVESDSD